ncbi:MAG: metallophosphoesterase [Candidatus Riflebacteria bacterium]|nr:metallophosphoesterase [Candidatus Riflebacteria bacterium]
MLVFISDLHLSDGTTGNTISSGAFKEFADSIQRILDKEDAKIKELQMVFLGDIFDLIRSEQWQNTSIRPWSEEEDKDKGQQSLKDWTGRVFSKIKENENNKACVGFLKSLKTKISEKIPVIFHYVIGNHDWLLNRYPEIRQEAAEFLGVNGNFSNTPFPEEMFFPEYHVFARHGDKFDWMNYDGKTRNSSSIGDAMVIDILTKFPKEVKSETEAKFHDPNLIERLKDIDNVRPLYTLPIWLDSVCRKSCSPRAIDFAKAAWNKLVDEFFKNPFVSSHDSWGPDKFDIFEAVFKIKPGWGLGSALKLSERLLPSDYQSFARKEAGLWKGETRYVVYGHTHDFQVSPIGTYDDGGKDIAEVYFNSGTWRKFMQKVVTFDGTTDFVGWQVMTSVIFYLEKGEKKERQGRPFEILNGVLGLKA